MRLPTTTAQLDLPVDARGERLVELDRIGGADHARRGTSRTRAAAPGARGSICGWVEVVEPDRDDLPRPDRCGQRCWRPARRAAAPSGRPPPAAPRSGLRASRAAGSRHRRARRGIHRRRPVPSPAAWPSTYSRSVGAEQEALRRRARAGLAAAAARAPPARAHFRAMGIDPARLGGPIIGVASTWTGTMPCNLNLRGSPTASPTAWPPRRRPARVQHDRGLRQPVAGTPGMRVADLARGDRRLDRADGARARLRRLSSASSAATRSVPAALMALARVDKPAVVLFGGPMRAGRWRDRDVTIQDVWEAVGPEERG